MKTPDRLVSLSSDLFFQQGYSAVGLNQILSAAKISKTTFYKYFDSLEELMVAAIRTEATRWFNRLDKALARTNGNGHSKLDTVIDVAGEWIVDERLKGCPFARAVSEFPDRNDPRYQAAARVLRRLAEEVEHAADDAGLKEPLEFARKFQSVLAGSCIIGGALDDAEQLRRMRDMTDLLLARAEKRSAC